MTWLVGLWSRLSGSKIGQAVAVILGALLAYRLHKRSIERDVREEITQESQREALELEKEMRDANDAARNDDVVDRLRSGGF